MERKKRTKKCTRRPPLSGKHYAAIELLAESGRKRLTKEKIARKLGISRRTLYRYRQRSDFEKQLRLAIDRKFGPRRKDDALVAARTGDMAYLERFFSAYQAVQSE
jgi:predicted DNA-binding transcriptional regulator YafY